MIGPRMELVAGRRTEQTEWGLRSVRDTVFHKAGYIDEHHSLEYALSRRERPFCGWSGDEQLVSRTVVTYTTEWHEVPGYAGSRWFSCAHRGTPQGRQPGTAVPEREGPDYQRPHAFRERDMTLGEEGVRQYRCPVCGLLARHAGDVANPQRLLF